MSDVVFNELRRYFSDRIIVEMTTAIGYWTMVGRFLGSLQVDIDRQSVGSAQDLFGRK